MALARVAFKQKKWSEAEQRYRDIIEKYPNTTSVPEARYWGAVSHYKGTNDHSVLGQVAEELKKTAPESLWAQKAIPWLQH